VVHIQCKATEILYGFYSVRIVALIRMRKYSL